MSIQMRNKIFFIIPEAKDVYDVILPVFVLSKILGLAPFKYERLINYRHFVPHCGPFVIMRFVFVIGVMGYVAEVIRNSNYILDMVWLALSSEICCGIIVTSVIFILAITNQKLIIKAIENITKMDHNMIKLKIKITYKNAQKFAYFQICGITCIFLTKVILQVFTTEHYIFVYNVLNIVDFINTVMLFQYVDILLLLRQRYIWLNREIKKLVIQKEYTRTQVKLFKFANEIPLSCEESEYIAPEKLIDLRKLHMQLFECAKLINYAYGIQLLFTICARFIMITTQLITTCKIISQFTKDDIIPLMLIGIYLLLHFSKIFMIASISENTAAKANDTGVVLHTLWNGNGTLRDQITIFSLQILHQNLNFTAAGFFILDYTLIHSIVGAVTAYLIIIIQFNSK